MTVSSNKEMKGKKGPLLVVSPCLCERTESLLAFIRRRVWEYYAIDRSCALVCADNAGWPAAE